jgi:hypothetical protein
MRYLQLIAVLVYSSMLTNCDENISVPHKIADDKNSLVDSVDKNPMVDCKNTATNYTICDSACAAYPDTTFKSFTYDIESSSWDINNSSTKSLRHFTRTINVTAWKPALEYTIQDSGKYLEYSNGKLVASTNIDTNYSTVDTSYNGGSASPYFPYLKYMPDSNSQDSLYKAEYCSDTLILVHMRFGYTFMAFMQKYGLVDEQIYVPAMLPYDSHTSLIKINNRPFYPDKIAVLPDR